MKCDELKRKYSDITGPYYGCNEVDEAIDELKKKLMPCLNGDCILTCEVVEKYGKENAELKAEIESLKASHYAESVDEGMRERRLRRALYNACANWAKCEERINNRDAYEASEYLPSAEDKFRKNAERWREMETKCRAKAEEYK